MAKVTIDRYKVRKKLLDAMDDNSYSKPLDIQVLERKEAHFLFVYGTLKRGQNRNIMLQGMQEKGLATFIGPARTVDGDYNMYRTAMTVPFPIVFAGTDEKKYNGRIFGELYLVRPTVLLHLDYIESNGEMYSRKKRKVNVFRPDTDPNKGISAWIYLGCRPFWKNREIIQMVRDYNKTTKTFSFNFDERSRFIHATPNLTES